MKGRGTLFIRKRTYNSKRYGVTESYQVIETYRENGKVKQRVICNLGKFSTPEAALEQAESLLRDREEVYSNMKPHNPRDKIDVRECTAEERKRVETLKYVVSKL